MTVYEQEGFKNRKDYLNNLSEDFGIPPDIVYMMADLLGQSEDFDGLITSLEDYAEEY
jgi:hypothetical protein